jgi:hypothetical protein
MKENKEETITEGFGFESNPISDGPAPFIKGTEFDGQGLTLEVVGMEKYKPELGADGKDYGVKNTYGAGGVLTKEHYLVSKKILEEGQTFKYKFLEGETPRYFDNCSVGFFFAINKAELKAGDKVLITRNKKSSTDIDWLISKI